MTAVHVALFVGSYAVKAALTYVVWRRFGPRVRALVRLGRSRRSAGRPVLARATPGHLSRTFRLGPPLRSAAPSATPAARSLSTRRVHERTA